MIDLTNTFEDVLERSKTWSLDNFRHSLSYTSQSFPYYLWNNDPDPASFYWKNLDDAWVCLRAGREAWKTGFVNLRSDMPFALVQDPLGLLGNRAVGSDVIPGVVSILNAYDDERRFRCESTLLLRVFPEIISDDVLQLSDSSAVDEWLMPPLWEFDCDAFSLIDLMQLTL